MKRQTDDTYIKYIHTKPCIVCGVEGVESHHWQGTNLASIDKKSDDYYAIPLCTKHHIELHKGILSWGKKHFSCLNRSELNEKIYFEIIKLLKEYINGNV